MVRLYMYQQFADQATNVQCGTKSRPTAILYWTYRAELTNDPSFRVNQKGVTVKPHASVRKHWNIPLLGLRFCTTDCATGKK